MFGEAFRVGREVSFERGDDWRENSPHASCIDLQRSYAGVMDGANITIGRVR